MMKKTLLEGLPRLGLDLSEQTADTLCAFGAAVVEQNKVMNLTAITEPDQVAKLHLLDSLSILAVKDLRGKRMVDVGCGAGFPGVPVKIACPEVELTLLANCVTARAEEAVATVRETYDIATSRAVARLNILLELTAPFVKVGGFVLAMKGTAAHEELEEAKKAIKTLGLKLEEVREFPVDGTAHTVIVLKKVAPTPAKYPRRFAKIKQAPL